MAKKLKTNKVNELQNFFLQKGGKVIRANVLNPIPCFYTNQYESYGFYKQISRVHKLSSND
jgi:hypothetical protein